jgi:hypothetical protein
MGTEHYLRKEGVVAFRGQYNGKSCDVTLHYITLHWIYFDNLTQRYGEAYVQTNYTVTLRPKMKT